MTAGAKGAGMPRGLKHTRTLIYYDGPQLIVAEEPDGTAYLCMVVEIDEDYDRYLCAFISAERLAKFEAGKLDLLDIFKNPELEEGAFEGTYGYSEENFPLQIEPLENIPEDWLPEEGIFMEAPKGA